MATKYIKTKGKAFWAKVFEENRDLEGYEGNYREVDGMYTINVAVEKDEIDKLKAAGTAKKPSLKDDGTLQYKFTRPHNGKFEWASGAPVVTKHDGTEWDFEKDGHIPNGSLVECENEVYTTSKQNGTRLKSVKVLAIADENGDVSESDSKGVLIDW